MKITKSDIADFIAFTQPSLSAEAQAIRKQEIETQFEEFNGEREVVFLSRDADGKIQGVLYCIKAQEGVFALANARIGKERDDSAVYGELAREALANCRSLGASRVLVRWISGAHPESRKALFEELGFKAGSKRIEFRRELSELPDENGAPLSWQSANELTESEFDRIGGILKAAGQGDPDFHPDDDPVELLKGYLEERGLSSGPNCIHLGYLGGELASIVIAQVQNSDGWSRITYMGLLPEFRGRDLGVWVHRHGFRMMREQGGKLYHGGTLEKNSAMIRLFETHGCSVYREMQEWELSL